jgi:MazG family protein
MEKLLEVMARLRDPERGCPWDVEQDFASIAPYTIEEAYEVADAIDRGDLDALREELGDLLLQVVYHAQMASEKGAFGFGDVVETVVEKMIRRHPHVFGEAEVATAEAQREAWEAHKDQERDQKRDSPAGVLDDVGLTLPALMRAGKLGQRAARVGFDWPDSAGVRAKVDEELAELDEAVATANRERLAEEAGDLLFATAQLLRHLGLEPEECLRRGNRKFESRFRALEAGVRDTGRRWADTDADELEALWAAVKAAR